ncbi:hypothetical protein HPB50_013762 [Hyalomma asiaticum]|uniref:Uncharacterized protein n=1 Tax=Hyalomma asiaticum TaxID=266040 RepID=A0ACB7TK88_HYAAI|nr:hypothetical protein HPB50_013762 [Hyalomma asiaticum]
MLQVVLWQPRGGGLVPGRRQPNDSAPPASVDMEASRVTFLLLCVVFAALLTGATLFVLRQDVSARLPRPHIVFVLADDLVSSLSPSTRASRCTARHMCASEVASTRPVWH